MPDVNRFLDPLILEPQEDGKLWKVVTPFTYDIGEIGGETIAVPAGFLSDLGSVPRLFWNLIPPIGKPLRAFVLHDWLYACQIYSRSKSDAVLLEAMQVCDVPWLKRWAIYLGVKSGGWIAWNQNKKKSE